jgi:hypothetical protein
LLRRSIESVLGWHVSVRYQLGRGSVRAEDLDDGEPGVPGATAPVHVDEDSIDRALAEGLGAQVVGENEPSSGKAAK